MSKVVVRRRRALVLQIALAVLFASLVALVARPAEAAYPGGNDLIVFESGFELYVMPSDGSAAPLQISPQPGGANFLEADPMFSPDGTMIAFSQSNSSGGADVWVSPFDPANPVLPSKTSWTQVTNGGADGEPTWSPDGTTIAFERAKVWNPVLGTATLADALGITLTDSGTNFNAAFVTAGSIVTNVTDGSTGKVLRVDSDTQLTLEARLSGGTNNDWGVGDNYTIETTKLQIWSAPADGSDKTGTFLSSSDPNTPTWDERSPVWSPLGDKIAFESNELGNSDIYTMNTDGTGAVLLTGGTTQFDDHTRNPSWSPDGLRIAFDSNEPNGVGGVNVWTVDASNGGNAVNVTGSATGSDNDTNPAWSPDGMKIAFTRASGTIWTISPDGTGLAQVNAGAPATQKEADWRPTVVGVDDAYTVDEGATLDVPATGVLTNDGTVGALPAATASKVTDPVNGSLTLNADGSFTYTHDGSETTSDVFTYRPVQGTVQGSIATVNITVTPKNDAPKAVDDGPYVTENGGTVTQPAPGVLANDTDAEGSALTAMLKTDVSNGTLTLNADGSFTYTHDGSDTTLDSFTYQAKDSNGALSNVATVSFTIGAKPGGVHTVGLVDPASGKWYLYDDSGKLKTSFFYGNPGDYPFMGDWDGDGIETPGLYRQSDGFVYLRNSNTEGIADIRFFFGNPGDVPIAGDFNGDGFDTVSIYRPSNQTFYIINKLGENDGGLGAAEFSYVFGNPGDKPFVGDFNGNGVETVGLHRESTGLVYFRNTHTQGNADNQFIFGNPGDRLVAGDWTNDATFTPALYRPSDTTMYFRHTNTQGNADNQFIPVPTDSSWLPVSGYTGG